MNIPLGCQCGEVVGDIRLSSDKDCTRLVCCCKDCQAFTSKLSAGDVLDEFGGTEVFQVLPNAIQIKQGSENLRCVKLSPKGLHRWHTVCCNTLVGNSISAKMPFFGMIHSFIKLDREQRDAFKPISVYLFERDALKPIPFKQSHNKMPLSFMGKAIFSILVNKIKGNGLPSPFYFKNGHAIAKPQLLD